MDKARVNKIYDRTNGYCHICHKKLSRSNYGKYGTRGAWEIDHSVAKVNGGTNGMNNLLPACISCNRSKGAKSTAHVRRKNGKARAPLSKANREQLRRSNQRDGAILVSLGGLALMGVPGIIVGGIIGMVIGEESTPKK